ncbi:Crp/Fnr family transcriptional regulator [Pontibacter sp. Tf4]|uniref:Crp/Fnr family transcriptional regulator n=1 Tax=Pontibacter sp. Tf4 TaxID=2761620 RepID=UPI001629DD73|nr:Crp/Fnr family transcriptional regulator [Pontibacter sp. Tf4]MBB6611800.1 Crp/Fnr family transcriptional regulator [Pontibacter sp. Tf4]
MEDEPNIFDVLAAFHPVSRELREHLNKVLLSRTLKKGQVLLRPGRVPAQAWFIQDGAARAYVFDDRKGEQVSVWFWTGGDFMLALDSFCRQLPTSFYIELLEDSTLLSLSYSQLEETAERFPAFRHIERSIMEACLHRLYRHYHARAHLPAKARFEKLMGEQPWLFQVAPVKDIASFLGMYPDTLSRLRGER